MPSGAITHKENFHECMALHKIATLYSTHILSQGNFHESSSIYKIRESSPSKITYHMVFMIICTYVYCLKMFVNLVFLNN